MTVLNPLRHIDEHIMDDADLAGPLLFCFCFGISLLFVSLYYMHQIPLLPAYVSTNSLCLILPWSLFHTNR